MPGNVAANARRVAEALHGLARQATRGAEEPAIAIFPELFLTGYAPWVENPVRHELLARLALPAGHPILSELAEAARQSGVSVVVGFAEADARGRLYNAALFAGAQGARAIYRKVHLYDRERVVFIPGESPCVVEVGGVRLGIGICFDLEFPEWSRLLALQGATLLVFPAAYMEPWRRYPRWLARARAMENQCYVAVANRVGQDGVDNFFGGSVVYGPQGELVARAPLGRPAAVGALLEMGLVDEARRGPFFYLGERQPRAYAGLHELAASQVPPVGEPWPDPS